MGRWTGKRWSRALQHARGQSNKRGAVKNQYLLINFPTLLACKKPAEQCLYWHSSPPSLYLSFQTQGPNRQRCNQSGKLDGGQTGEKGTGIGSHVGLGQKKQLNGCHFLRKGISEGGLWFYVMNLSPCSVLTEVMAVARAKRRGVGFLASWKKNKRERKMTALLVASLPAPSPSLL